MSILQKFYIPVFIISKVMFKIDFHNFGHYCMLFLSVIEPNTLCRQGCRLNILLGGGEISSLWHPLTEISALIQAPSYFGSL